MTNVNITEHTASLKMEQRLGQMNPNALFKVCLVFACQIHVTDAGVVLVWLFESGQVVSPHCGEAQQQKK